METEFNEALKSQLDAAGFTNKEQILGTLAAKFRTALDMLGVVARNIDEPLLVLTAMTMSRTYAQVFSHATEGMDIARVFAAAEIIRKACLAKAAKDLPEMETGPMPVMPISTETSAIN